MFDWTARLLHWRKGNDVIVHGKQIQFIPWHGIYVVTRQYNGRTVMTVINGRNTSGKLEVKRYAEIMETTQLLTMSAQEKVYRYRQMFH